MRALGRGYAEELSWAPFPRQQNARALEDAELQFGDGLLPSDFGRGTWVWSEKRDLEEAQFRAHLHTLQNELTPGWLAGGMCLTLFFQSDSFLREREITLLCLDVHRTTWIYGFGPDAGSLINQQLFFWTQLGLYLIILLILMSLKRLAGSN